MMQTRSLLFAKFAVWFALLAVLLQIAAIPVANRHMLQQAIDQGQVHTITICTVHGSKQLQVGEDGQPVTKPAGHGMAHCPICFAGGAAPLLLNPVFGLLKLFMVCCPAGADTQAPAMSGAGLFWPFSMGPPV